MTDLEGLPEGCKARLGLALPPEGGQRSAWGSGRQPGKFLTSLGLTVLPCLKKEGVFLWQRVFKCLCFTRKSSYQKKPCTKPQSIKQPKSELAALAEAEGEGAGVHTPSIPLTPRGGPVGRNWGLGASGNLEVPMDSSVLGFYVAYEHSARMHRAWLASCRLGHTLGPRDRPGR